MAKERLVMWEHEAWIVLERIIGLLTLVVLAFCVWNSLLRIEAKQVQQAKDVSRLEQLIIDRLKDPESWKKSKLTDR